MDQMIYINSAYEAQAASMPLIDYLRSQGMALQHGNGSEEKVAECAFVVNLVTAASHTSKTYRKVLNHAYKCDKDMFMFQMREGRPVSEMGDVLDLIMTLFKYQHAAPAKSPEEEALAEDHAVAEKIAAHAEAEAAAGGEEEQAQSNERNAFYQQGLRFLKGDGCEKDDAKAFDYFKQAANQGMVLAQYQLSICYAGGIGVKQDINEAARWCEMAAYGGHLKAQEEIGYCYETGYGVTRNMREAIRWYRIAAEQGSSDARNNLAYCYQKGKGVSRDIKKAIMLYTQAAEQGHASAQFNLGFIFWYGEGIDSDRERAITLFEASEANGNQRAANMMKVIRQLGYVKKEKEKARDTEQDAKQNKEQEEKEAENNE